MAKKRQQASGIRSHLRPWVAAILAASWFSGLALAGPQEDFTKLAQELERAGLSVQAAHREAVASGKSVDPSKLPPDPQGQILDRMDALTRASGSSPDGEFFAIETLYHSLYVGNKKSIRRFEYVAEHFPDAGFLPEILPQLAGVYGSSGTAKEWDAALTTIIEKVKSNYTKLLALSARGQVLLADGQADTAAKVFRDIIKLDSKSMMGQRAKRFLYEIENLQVGMQAPDFVATTVDGEKLALRSQRGKILFLNFWATW